MGSLADTYGGSSGRSGRSGGRPSGDGAEPLVRSGSPEGAETADERQIGTALTLAGVVLLVVGVGIAFFSATLLATLGYSLLVAVGTAVVAHHHLASTPTAAVVVGLAVAAGRRWIGRGRGRGRGRTGTRNGRLGRRRSTRSTRGSRRGRPRRRSPLASVWATARRLVARVILVGRQVARVGRPERDRRDRL